MSESYDNANDLYPSNGVVEPEARGVRRVYDQRPVMRRYNLQMEGVVENEYLYKRALQTSYRLLSVARDHAGRTLVVA